MDKQALAAAVTAINKHFGKGAIIRLGDDDDRLAVEVIPTGRISIDTALGIGGVPRGRVVEIYGPESGGKTTLTHHIIAEAQRLGGTAAFVDAEHALDPTHAKALGVDTDNLFVSQPDNGEQALEIVEKLVQAGVDIVVVDSVAALVPKAELEGEMGDPQMGLQARLMSQAMRKLTAVVSKTSCCLIFINQIREKIGVMFGNPETTTGGRALKFYASIRMDVRKKTAIKDGDKQIGVQTNVKVVKNKCAAPFREALVDILYGKGISREIDMLRVGVAEGIVEKRGTFLYFDADQLGQGEERARQYLEENPSVSAAIESKIKFRRKEAADKAAAKKAADKAAKVGSTVATPIVKKA